MGVLCGVGCSATKLERQKNADFVDFVRQQTADFGSFFFCFQHARDMAQPLRRSSIISGFMLVGHQWECTHTLTNWVLLSFGCSIRLHTKAR